MNEFDLYNSKYNGEALDLVMVPPRQTKAKIKTTTPMNVDRPPVLSPTKNMQPTKPVKKKKSYWDEQMKLSEVLETRKRALVQPTLPPAKKMKQSTLAPPKTTKKDPKKEGPFFKVGSQLVPLARPRMSVDTITIEDTMDIGSFESSSSSSDEQQDDQQAFAIHQTVFDYVQSTKEKSGEPGATPQEDDNGNFLLTEEGQQPAVFIACEMAKKLKSFQKEGVKFMFKLWQAKRGGILGDEMGLGKTVQTITFISCMKGGKVPLEKSFFFSPTKRLKQRENTGVLVTEKPFLVICPAGIIDQWTNEFVHWAYLKVSTFAGKGRCRSIIMATENKIDVMLCSYELFRSNFADINNVDWAAIVFDEVHKIKSQTAKLTKECLKLKTACRIGLTGTLIQNNFDELWTVSDILYPGFLGTQQHFRSTFDVPIRTGQRHDASTSQIAKGRMAAADLAAKMSNFLLRRTKDCIQADLPGKEDNVLFCSLTPLQIAAYKRVLASPLYRNLRAQQNMDADEFAKQVFPAIMRLQKMCNHLALMEPSTKETKASHKSDDEKKYEKIAFGTEHGTIKQLISGGDHKALSGKLYILAPLLHKWKTDGSKVLLFSNSTRMMDILGRFLRSEKHSFSRIDGSTPVKTRSLLVDQFNKNKAQFVFLVSTKACGLGLNLTSANIVVIFDPNWNATWDLQAQDRAHRIGQTKFTKVFRLIAAGTIEEMQYNRQIYKQQLAQVGLNGSSSRRYFNGVAGMKGQEGEIFGLSNLFQLCTDTSLTNEIIQRTVEQENLYNDLTTKPKSKYSKSESNEEDIQLVEKLGVLYTHRNQDIVGESDMERDLSLQAIRMEQQAPLPRFMMGGLGVVGGGHAHHHAGYGAPTADSGAKKKKKEMVKMPQRFPELDLTFS